MRKIKLFGMDSPYREELQISGYCFGHGEKAACIVGSIRGNEVQQLYVCSQIIRKLGELEAANVLNYLLVEFMFSLRKEIHWRQKRRSKWMI